MKHPNRSLARPMMLYVVFALLAACGGGGSSGGGSGGGGGGGAAAYTVGGGISGLSASGLVLLDNGGDALTVSPSATSFQFNGTLTNGAAYAVSVQTQPTNQFCSVSGGSGTVNGSNVSNVTVSCSAANVVALTVDAGAASSGNQTFNTLLTTVTVCLPNTTTCATINNVLVDTGSSGLRIMKSALGTLALGAMADPGNASNHIYECRQFADGFTWGAVSRATIQIAGESAASIPVQIVDDSQSPTPGVPTGCANSGGSRLTVDDFNANAVLGVGVHAQDCGTACTGANTFYYSCNASNTCSTTGLPQSDQVANPVAGFAADNNGVIVDLPLVAATGAATASGSLIFGIGTESNNALGSATVLTTDANGYITTSYQSETLANSFIDSGSNALYFPDSSITACTDLPQFFCPGSSSGLSQLTLSATNQGNNGTQSPVQFQVANLDYLAAHYQSNFAQPDVAGPAGALPNISNYFDWGLPFFYGRKVYVAIEGLAAGGATGPYYAY